MSKSEEFGEGIVQALAEAVTGARAAPRGIRKEGRDLVAELGLDWDGCPGGLDLPDGVTLRVGPYGDYEARLAEATDPFASGLLQRTLARPARVRVGALIRVTERELFRSSMGVSGERRLTASDLDQRMLRLPVEGHLAGIDRVRVAELSLKGEEVYLEVLAEVSDPRALTRAAREAYLEAWGDNTWLPASPREALFELALGSNANPSPADIGFEFLGYGGTREEARVREAADREIGAQPGLVPDERVRYGDWLDLTGLDDGFVGWGETRLGTRDLFEAAIRAVSDPDPSGPEPD